MNGSLATILEKRARKWVISFTWNDLLFAHWPVRPEILRPHVPHSVEIDTFARGKLGLALSPST